MIYEEEFVEERDLDEDVQLKKDLIEKAKSLNENEDLQAGFKEVATLQKQWKNVFAEKLLKKPV